MSTLNFDASQVVPNSGASDPIPVDKYPMAITASEMKGTKDGTGAFLLVELTVLDGQYAGRKVWDRLNLDNKNPVAVEIAYGTLSAICHACNILQVGDSQQLHGIPMMVSIGIQPAKGDFEASNKAKSYKAMNVAGQVNVATMAPAAVAQPVAMPVAAPVVPVAAPAPVAAPVAPAPVAAPVGAAAPPWAAPAAPAPVAPAPVAPAAVAAPVAPAAVAAPVAPAAVAAPVAPAAGTPPWAVPTV